MKKTMTAMAAMTLCSAISSLSMTRRIDDDVLLSNQAIENEGATSTGGGDQEQVADVGVGEQQQEQSAENANGGEQQQEAQASTGDVQAT